METIIKFLSVGKGDSIVINLKKGNESFVALIDGGEIRHSNYVYDELSIILKDNKKDGPDLVVCSHYDSDHIGGLIELTKRYGNKIKRFWVHRPNHSLKDSLIILNESLQPNQRTMEHKDSKIFKQSLLGGDYKLLDKAELIIESLRQLDFLIDLIDYHKISNESPFSDKTQIAKWQNRFELIGPTEAFYNSVKSTFKDYKDFALKESYFELREARQPIIENFKQYSSPCENLKQKSYLSVSNRTSTIFKITDSAGTEYLLTADADIEALSDMLERNNFSRNLIMQIPHHGSLNNLSKNIIDILKPVTGIISADGSKHHPNYRILNCLQSRNIRCYSTNKHGAIIINNGTVTTEK
jgi:beta-lactamase superfamily II metal-dependent hydrolase